ncbi:MAG TPA: hypothetical protein VLA93_04735 [Pyrinomonadaceae bacterium]|nr:hypothetical protein [Pyrinomonadaceae bacterium]
MNAFVSPGIATMVHPRNAVAVRWEFKMAFVRYQQPAHVVATSTNIPGA